MDDEFGDPLDDADYDSEIEYDDEFESSMKIKKEITFEEDYQPLKFGIKQEKMEIVLEYQRASNHKRFQHYIQLEKYFSQANFKLSVSHS